MSIKKILDENFEYKNAIKNRYYIPKKKILIGNKEILFELLVTNGFVKLYTIRGRLYGIAQVVNNGHESPDWKFHFNICFEDIYSAWEIIVSCFLIHIQKYYENKNIKINNNDIFFYMKSININLNTNFPNDMSGREITVYIYKHDDKINGMNNEGVYYNEDDKNGKEIKVLYNKNDDEFPFYFWCECICEIENKLKNIGIKKRKLNDCADGDLWIGNFTSLRNEAFVENKFDYPPNEIGWNGAKHEKPFSWRQIFILRYKCYYKNKIYNYLFYLSYIIIFISIIPLILKKSEKIYIF